MKTLHFLFLCGLSGAGMAHEYWIERDGAGFVLHQGHMTAAHAGAASVAYDPATVVRIDCRDESGKNRTQAPHGSPVRIDGKCVAVTIHLDSGYWTKTPYDTLNKPRTEVKGALQSWRSNETVTRLERWSPALARAAGPGLILSLPADPAKLRVDDKFTVLATLDGVPRADVPIAYDGATRGATDADGHIRLRVRHAGLQQISASLETPLADGKADTLIQGATLNFVLP